MIIALDSYYTWNMFCGTIHKNIGFLDYHHEKRLIVVYDEDFACVRTNLARAGVGFRIMQDEDCWLIFKYTGMSGCEMLEADIKGELVECGGDYYIVRQLVTAPAS